MPRSPDLIPWLRPSVYYDGRRAARDEGDSMGFEQAVEWAGKGLDAAGVCIIAIGAIIVTGMFLGRIRAGMEGSAAYTLLRQGLGRAILLGLEFLVAGDIVRTVAVSPTF